MASPSFAKGRSKLLWWGWVCIVMALIVCATSEQRRPSSAGPSWRTARSLGTSLLQRIANHRLAKGDYSGAERIKNILSSFDRGIYFWKNMGSIGWDYLVHYSWRSLNPSMVVDVLRLINDIQSAVAEFLGLPSDVERLQWLTSNYDRILQLAKSSLHKLLKLIDQPGALRNFVLSLQTEVITGNILRDAMQLGAADLQSLMQVAKDMLQRYYGPTFSQSSSEL